MLTIPMISGPVGILLLAVALVVGLVVWLRRGRRYPGLRLHGADPEIDHEELEEAEREVRDLKATQHPDQGFLGDDWGPGAGRPRPPERL
jgi:hypothetical protein